MCAYSRVQNRKNEYLIFLLSCLFLISCTKKESTTDTTPKNCYSCEIFTGVGSSYKKDTCVYKWDSPQFRDAQGNNLNWICTPK